MSSSIIKIEKEITNLEDLFKIVESLLKEYEEKGIDVDDVGDGISSVYLGYKEDFEMLVGDLEIFKDSKITTYGEMSYWNNFSDSESDDFPENENTSTEWFLDHFKDITFGINEEVLNQLKKISNDK